jgi:hypothetical protein
LPFSNCASSHSTLSLRLPSIHFIASTVPTHVPSRFPSSSSSINPSSCHLSSLLRPSIILRLPSHTSNLPLTQRLSSLATTPTVETLPRPARFHPFPLASDPIPGVPEAGKRAEIPLPAETQTVWIIPSSCRPRPLPSPPFSCWLDRSYWSTTEPSLVPSPLRLPLPFLVLPCYISPIIPMPFTVLVAGYLIPRTPTSFFCTGLESSHREREEIGKDVINKATCSPSARHFARRELSSFPSQLILQDLLDLQTSTLLPTMTPSSSPAPSRLSSPFPYTLRPLSAPSPRPSAPSSHHLSPLQRTPFSPPSPDRPSRPHRS